jgi:hypothetical protein
MKKETTLTIVLAIFNIRQNILEAVCVRLLHAPSRWSGSFTGMIEEVFYEKKPYSFHGWTRRYPSVKVIHGFPQLLFSGRPGRIFPRLTANLPLNR